MKTKSTLLKTTLLALFLFSANGAFAAIRYICAGATLSLSAGTAPSGITYSWDVKKDGSSIPDYPSTTAPTSLPTEAGSYQVILISTAASSAVCAPDNVITDFVVLPDLVSTLAANNAAYCIVATTKSSDVTQTITFPTAYAADLESEYVYSVTKDGVGVTPATYGTIDASGNYKLTTLVAGVYKIKTTVNYKLKTGSGNLLASSSGCPKPSNEVTITVTAAPTTPSITINVS